MSPGSPGGTPLPAAPPLHVERLRGLPYEQAEARMRAALEARIAGTGPDTLFLVEPAPVFTLGRRKEAASHVLDAGDIPVVDAARGGDVTFHGPGQIVAWPVVALPPDRRDLHLWLHGLEHVVIEVLADLGLAAGRDPRNTGVWLGGQKVCAIGIGCRRWVAWHGLALNLTTDLSAFQRIQPCGLAQDTVTRMADHLDTAPDWTPVADAVARRLAAWWWGPDPRAEVEASLAAHPPR